MKDFAICAKTALMKRGRAAAIVEEMVSAGKCWPEFGVEVKLSEEWRDEIRSSRRLTFPQG